MTAFFGRQSPPVLRKILTIFQQPRTVASIGSLRRGGGSAKSLAMRSSEFLHLAVVAALFACALGDSPAAMAKTVQKHEAKPSPAMPFSGRQEATEITAEESLEWHKDKHLYVARGNAKAVRGDVRIEADILAAHEREKPPESAAEGSPDKGNGKLSEKLDGKGDIDSFTAEGNVRIITPDQQVFGEKAVYDLERGIMQLTGTGLKYVSGNGVVTAKDSMEYYEESAMAVARGSAVATSEGKRVSGDIMTAVFAPLAGGGMEVSQMTVQGNVAVVTAEGVSRGDLAVYDPKRKIAVLSGNVKVTSGEAELSGDKAEVDFVSGVSRLLSDASSGGGKGRVRALLSSSQGGAGKASSGLPSFSKIGAPK